MFKLNLKSLMKKWTVEMGRDFFLDVLGLLVITFV